MTAAPLGDKLLDHYRHPRNQGELADADGVGSSGGHGCGREVVLQIRVRQERIAEIRFQLRGEQAEADSHECLVSLAAASAMTELALGRYLDDAAEMTELEVAEALGGVPEDDWQCLGHGLDALHAAIMDYVRREIGRLSGRQR